MGFRQSPANRGVKTLPFHHCSFELTSQQVTFNGQSFHVNARVQRGGYLKAELPTLEGESVMDYQLAQCDPVTGDVMSARVSWGQKKFLRCPVDESLRLVFALKNAKLYSFWIE